MKDIKLTLDAGQLVVVVVALESNDTFPFFPTTDIDKLFESLREELYVRFRKKQVERRPKQKFSLKLHEAIALKHLLKRFNFSGPYEQNTTRILITAIDKAI